MLVLSRKVGERVLIGDEISVTVVRLANGSVRLGIEAPHEMNVIREELAASIEDDLRSQSNAGERRSTGSASRSP